MATTKRPISDSDQSQIAKNKTPPNKFLLNPTPVASSPQKNLEKNSPNASPGTKITIKYDVGFKNTLYVRGKGANLSWDKGIPLRNVKADEWIWEPEGSFVHCEFKILINDARYEAGENHHLNPGMKIQYTPNFFG